MPRLNNKVKRVKMNNKVKRFELRLPLKLYHRLKREAAQAVRSLHSHLIFRLSLPFSAGCHAGRKKESGHG